MRTMALLVFSLAWPYPEHASGQMSQTTHVMFQRAILMADSDDGAPIVAADRAIEETDRANALLAGRVAADDVPALSRVRSSDASIATLIDRATAKSPTFKTLRAKIDASDGIVYVESGQCSHGVWACIQFWMQVRGPNRFLRIVVDRRNTSSDRELMGSIGHELWHALEVLGERSITDGLRMFTFYEREGMLHEDSYETIAAIGAGNAVRRELKTSLNRAQ